MVSSPYGIIGPASGYGILGGNPPVTPPGGAMFGGGFRNFVLNNPALVSTIGATLLGGQRPGGGYDFSGLPAAMTLDAATRQSTADRAAADQRRAAMNKVIQNWKDIDPNMRQYYLANPEAFGDYVKTVAKPANAKDNLMEVDGKVYDAASGKWITPPPGAGSGPFEGTALDAQDSNILLNGDPASPEYALAYSRQFQTPKLVQGVDEQGRTIATPILPPVPPGIRPPTASQTAPMSATPPASAPGITPGLGGGAGMMPGTPIITGQKPKTEAQIKGETLLANVEPDYAMLTGPNGIFNVLGSTVDQIASEFGRVGEFAQSGLYQAAGDAVKNIVQSYIYTVSGAQAPEAEVRRNMLLLMPSVTDKPDRLKAKRARLDAMMDAIRARATAGAPSVPGTPAVPPAGPAQAAPPVDPLGIR